MSVAEKIYKAHIAHGSMVKTLVQINDAIAKCRMNEIEMSYDSIRNFTILIFNDGSKISIDLNNSTMFIAENICST
jgi:hypothetical protein